MQHDKLKIIVNFNLSSHLTEKLTFHTFETNHENANFRRNIQDKNKNYIFCV